MPGYSWGTTKPPAGVPLNRSHALTDALALYLPLNEGSGSLATDLVGGRAFTGTNIVWTPGAIGAASSSGHLANTKLPGNLFGTQMSMAFRIKWNGDAAGFPFVLDSTTGSNRYLFIIDSGSSYGLYINSVAVYDPGTFGTGNVVDDLIPSGVPCTMVFTWTTASATSNVLTYRNSKVVRTDSKALTVVQPAGLNLLNGNGNANPWKGSLEWFGLWQRILNPAEIRQLHTQPYEMFAPPVWRRYFIGGPAPVSGTLAGTIGAATGSFTAVETITSTLVGSVGAATGSLTAAETIASTLAGSIGSPTGSLSAAETITATLAGTIASPTGALAASAIDIAPVTQPGQGRSRPLLTRYRREPEPRFITARLQAPSAHLSIAWRAERAPRIIAATLTPIAPTLRAKGHALNPRHITARLAPPLPTLRTCRQLSAPGCVTLAVRATRPSLHTRATHTPDEAWLLALLLSDSREAMRAWSGEATKRLSRVQRELNAQVARTDAQQSRLVSAAQPHIRHALNVQRDAILVALPHAVKASVDTNALLDDPGYKDALVLLINALEDLQQAGVTLGYTDMTPNSAFDMQNPYVQAATTLLAQRISGINETTADAIRAAIADGLEQGLTAADMGTVIRDLGAFSDSRALTLSLTESRTALNLGNAAAFEEMGATEVLVADGDYDEVCAELDGSTQSLTWYQANPIGHPRCRRSATALPAPIPA